MLRFLEYGRRQTEDSNCRLANAENRRRTLKKLKCDRGLKLAMAEIALGEAFQAVEVEEIRNTSIKD